jgi:hypothetical protein
VNDQAPDSLRLSMGASSLYGLLSSVIRRVQKQGMLCHSPIKERSLGGRGLGLTGESLEARAKKLETSLRGAREEGLARVPDYDCGGAGRNPVPALRLDLQAGAGAHAQLLSEVPAAPAGDHAGGMGDDRRQARPKYATRSSHTGKVEYSGDGDGAAGTHFVRQPFLAASRLQPAGPAKAGPQPEGCPTDT